jgi:hypothetical protein
MIVEEQEQHVPVTKEMEVEMREETRNTSIEQNLTQQLGLGEPQKMNENDDERTKSYDPRG